MKQTYLSLGSNVGDRLGFLTQAMSKLTEAGIVTKISSVYETPPWGKEDQPAFLNACVEMRTKLEPKDLLYKLKQFEVEIGRQDRERWGPREIDIDIIFYDDEQLETDELTIPHPYMHERAFVLVPLVEIAPDVTHPVLGKTVQQLLDDVDTTGIDIFQG